MRDARWPEGKQVWIRDNGTIATNPDEGGRKTRIYNCGDVRLIQELDRQK